MELLNEYLVHWTEYSTGAHYFKTVFAHLHTLYVRKRVRPAHGGIGGGGGVGGGYVGPASYGYGGSVMGGLMPNRAMLEGKFPGSAGPLGRNSAFGGGGGGGGGLGAPEGSMSLFSNRLGDTSITAVGGPIVEIPKLAVIIWKSQLFTTMKDDLLRLVLQGIEQARDEGRNVSLEVRGVIESCLRMSRDQVEFQEMEFYVTWFEKPFLAATREYYQRKLASRAEEIPVCAPLSPIIIFFFFSSLPLPFLSFTIILQYISSLHLFISYLQPLLISLSL